LARIVGVNIPDNKRFVIALTYIFGIGSNRAESICKELKIDTKLRTSQLDEKTIIKVNALMVKRYNKLEGDLKRDVQSSITNLIKIGCYKGIRHRSKLPVNGQRSKTNARTRKGKKSIAVAGKKKI
jgi:small subunit ribosomal protein S13|tara:strand:- start:13433 stop:13810 length:378 start_codon:yes stop_codon:yes gene_type:complete